jgi:hypothetical protein
MAKNARNERDARSVSSKQGSGNAAAHALQFIGSMIFLGLIFWGGVGAQYSMNSWNALGGGVWLPVFFSLAVVASIALFFVSIANLASPGGIYRYGGMQLAAVAGICLTALTYGSASYFWAAVVGFIMAVMGGIFTR